MPELPEVETTRTGIAPFVEGGRIVGIEVRNAGLRWPVPVDDLLSMKGELVSEVQRRGKYIKLVCESGYVLVHLGMSGSLRILTRPEPPQKHDHVDMIMESGVIVRFNDPRRFGCWLFQRDIRLDHPLLAGLGPEPLSEDFDAQYLYMLSRKRSLPIKNFIMDSHVVVGVGNIYAAEALFRAGIHPGRAAGRVGFARYVLLVSAIREVLAAAIRQGGTTLRDYVNSDGKPGYFRQRLLVYGRNGEPCYACGQPVKLLRQAQRSTYFCTECQK